MTNKERNNAEAVKAFIEDPANRELLERTEQFFAGQWPEAFEDRQYAAEEILVQGDKAVARIAMTGTHVGAFAGIEATGRAIQATQFREFRLEDGRILEHSGWFDTGLLLPQLQSRP